MDESHNHQVRFAHAQKRSSLTYARIVMLLCVHHCTASHLITAAVAHLHASTSFDVDDVKWLNFFFILNYFMISHLNLRIYNSFTSWLKNILCPFGCFAVRRVTEHNTDLAHTNGAHNNKLSCFRAAVVVLQHITAEMRVLMPGIPRGREKMSQLRL